MKTAYFDCFAGISGDMILGAFIDAGLNFDELQQELSKLKLTGYELNKSSTQKNAIHGIKFDVIVSEKSKARNLNDIVKLINQSSLHNDIKNKSCEIFTKIGEVESQIHGKKIDEIHFHEVGAVDSIIDIVGSVIAVKLLGIEKVYASKIHLGTGFVKSMHGKIPVPAPATVKLLKGIPVYSSGIESELTTPTGAAIISSFSEGFGPMPDMKFDCIGYGAGTRDLEIPNLLRVFIGEMVQTDYITDNIVVVETNIDDMNPEFHEHITDLFMKNGALDFFTTPVIMKKSRPGIMMSILTDEKNLNKITEIIFSETTTSGVRLNRVERKKLLREIKTIDTEYGPVRVKINKTGSKIITVSPEYEDCKAIAKETGIQIKEIYDETKFIARSMFKDLSKR